MSPRPATIAEAARVAEAAALHRSIPDDIVFCEILVRLAPKPLLRCRAVCRAWRRAISTRRFLLAHHARQPTFPLLDGYAGDDGIIRCQNIIPFDHRAGLTATDQLQPVTQLGYDFFHVEASCDTTQFAICNLATRQYAPLPLLNGFMVLGIYRRLGEYRLLLNTGVMYDGPDAQEFYYHIFTLGSGQPPRCIGFGGEEVMFEFCPILLRGSLHWHIGQHGSINNMITVFDTTTESFRQQMRGPAVQGCTGLFDIGEMLAMPSYNDEDTIVDIWVMQDFECEVWALKYRVELPLAELGVQLGEFQSHCSVVVVSWEGDVLVLVKFGEWLLQVDMDGKLVASFQRRDLWPTQHRLKQSLVQHAFFPTLEGYIVNQPPFF